MKIIKKLKSILFKDINQVNNKLNDNGSKLHKHVCNCSDYPHEH